MNQPRRWQRCPCWLLAGVVVATLAGAQSGGEYEISRSTIASGAAASGDDLSAWTAVGQAAADPASASGGEYTLHGGFLTSHKTDRGELIFADGFEP